MKYFTLILSFYIFALVIFPCGDKSDCGQQDSRQNTLAEKHHSDHSEHSDHCSPFCICACCSHFITAPNLFVSHTNATIQYPNSRNLSIYKIPAIKEAFTKIWQPPKLS